MANLKPIVCLSFMISVGLMFLILACALPQYNNWWPFFVIVFYILSPVPTFISRRLDTEPSSMGRSLAHFLTTGIVISSFALPIILARSPYHNPVIDWGACFLALTGNVFIFVTILGFILMSDEENVEYSMW
ncbi:UNVERIFIED_CONTAM: hypothetical protein RMT77_008472 [Armadillidium vulgare]